MRARVSSVRDERIIATYRYNCTPNLSPDSDASMRERFVTLCLLSPLSGNNDTLFVPNLFHIFYSSFFVAPNSPFDPKVVWITRRVHYTCDRSRCIAEVDSTSTNFRENSDLFRSIIDLIYFRSMDSQLWIFDNFESWKYPDWIFSDPDLQIFSLEFWFIDPSYSNKQRFVSRWTVFWSRTIFDLGPFLIPGHFWSRAIFDLYHFWSWTIVYIHKVLVYLVLIIRNFVRANEFLLIFEI